MKAKNVVFALALTGLISTQAYAADTRIDSADKMTPQVAFSDADMQTMFEPTASSMQVAALSQQEMKETEGAYLANVAGAVVGLAGYGAFCTIGRSCSVLGALSAAGMGAISPWRGATQALTAARTVWGFNASVANGTAMGVASHYGH